MNKYVSVYKPVMTATSSPNKRLDGLCLVSLLSAGIRDDEVVRDDAAHCLDILLFVRIEPRALDGVQFFSGVLGRRRRSRGSYQYQYKKKEECCGGTVHVDGRMVRRFSG